MTFNFVEYKGPFVAVPEPIIGDLLRLFCGGETYNDLMKCVSYEPDNHHNAALCPYCSPEAVRKKNLEAYEKEMTPVGRVKSVTEDEYGLNVKVEWFDDFEGNDHG